MENEDRTERIDRYLDEALTPQEKVAFENEMSADADFRLEVEAQEAVRNLIGSQAEKEDLRRLFATFHSEMETASVRDEEKQSHEDLFKKKKGIVRRLDWGNWSYTAIAASVAILAGSAISGGASRGMSASKRPSFSELAVPATR